MGEKLGELLPFYAWFNSRSAKLASIRVHVYIYVHIYIYMYNNRNDAVRRRSFAGDIAKPVTYARIKKRFPR